MYGLTDLQSQTDLFPTVGVVEDPSVWRAADGSFHALFHHETGCAHFGPESALNCGGHAFSVDGIDWHYPYINGSAYGENASLVGGGMVRFAARQRPHVVLGPDGVTPVALTNGAQLVGEGGKAGDATITFLQPIANGHGDSR